MSGEFGRDEWPIPLSIQHQLAFDKVKKSLEGTLFQVLDLPQQDAVDFRLRVEGGKRLGSLSALEEPEKVAEIVVQQMVQSLINYALDLGVKYGIKDLRVERRELNERLRESYREQFSRDTVTNLKEVNAMLARANETDSDGVHWT